MDPFVWVWLSSEPRRWAMQARTVPDGCCLVAPSPLARNRALALAHRLGRSDLRVLLQSEVTSITALWKLKLACRGHVCVGGWRGAPASRVARAMLAASVESGEVTDGAGRSEGFRSSPGSSGIFEPRREVGAPGAIFSGTRTRPVWARAAGARRREVRALAAAGVVSP